MATGMQSFNGLLHGNLDIFQTATKCLKNHHHEYIKFQSFEIKDIPGRFSKDVDVFNAITHLGHLTVKVKVKKLSPKEADQKEYNNNKIFRGSQGSGRITEFIRHNCETTGEAGYEEVIVQTSCHLVGAQTEIEWVKCKIFFDNEENESISFRSTQILELDERRDICTIAFKINDMSVIERLKDSFQQFSHLSAKLHKKYSNVKDDDKLCVLVSHPHGCYKSISFGKWFRNRDGYYTYTARSCSSSSGGPLFLMGAVSHNLIHRGVDGTGENCSCLEDEVAKTVLTLPEPH